MLDKSEILARKAKVIRKHVITSIYNAGTGHPGGSLSCVDILVALYFEVMKPNFDRISEYSKIAVFGKKKKRN